MSSHSLRRGVLGKFIGDRAFYTMVLTIAVPIIIQNAITNFVSLLDNIMVVRSVPSRCPASPSPTS